MAHGARMVAFGGWHMPIQYAAGITREHIATRTNAGLFDVSHMGRIRCKGAGAAEYLASILTNDPRTLVPGQAHYTLLANEQGGAIDDAYLYRLGTEDFLLVVNASNREKDWESLRADGVPAGVALDDESERLAMVALQGPGAGEILASLIDSGALPEARRNRVRSAMFGSSEIIVARTGYTGESVCFEIFVPRPAAIALWQRLLDVGAQPVGLGARDSLRLEAGLPLYGHELGLDADGNDIPIFANALARFGVRPAGQGAYIGSVALEKQRAEYASIMNGACITPPHQRLLRCLVKPIAAFASRRPLRAGYQLFLDGDPVGYVTSGTSVPVARPGALLGDHADMRPIGLALIRSDIRYSADRRVCFTVRDGHSNLMAADLVERNLPPARV